MATDQELWREIADRHTTVADKIRALAAAGAPRADIARFLGKRYQHVRNVLEGDAQSGGYVLGKADLSGMRENGTPFVGPVDEREWVERRGETAYWLQPRPDGSLVLPKEVAAALGMTEGCRVFAQFKNGELKVVSGETAMERARALVRRIIPRGVSVVDSLIADRRAEAEREANDD